MNATLQLILIFLLAGGSTALIARFHQWDDPAATCSESLLSGGERCFSQLDLNAELLWIDARTKARWERDGVRGSRYYGADSLLDPSALDQLAPHLLTASQVVIYCGGGDCETSHQVADALRALDLSKEIVVLYGGHPSLPKSLLKGRGPKE